MTDLLSCPFCNRQLEHYEAIEATRHPKIPYGEYCPLKSFLFASDRTDIISAWNTRAQPQYLANCRDPDSCQRHGECMYLGCPHTGKVIVKRICVEPKQDGIVYPGVET